MVLTPNEEENILGYIPTQQNIDPLYDRGYHESKIRYAQAFNPSFSRAEAWAISMYLGPAYYCQRINHSLLGMPMPSEERNKFLLISKAVDSALEKLPRISKTDLQKLPQPDDRLPAAEYLKRFVHYPSELLENYEVGTTKTTDAFFQYHFLAGIFRTGSSVC